MSIRNDEPTLDDRLSRQKYAQAFARMCTTCETPLVVGLYGTWGMGKTSLMRQIELGLDKQKCTAVWFDAWQHQFDESPAVALLHQMVSSLGLASEAKKLLSVIAVALGAWGVKASTGLSATEIQSIGERWEAEHFEVLEARTKLREYFKKVVQIGRGDDKKRIVFFIDDLDRCLPSTALKLLEALKLFLNLTGCIYFLGVDRYALEQSVRFHYKDTDIREQSYLDKLVQLPFHIPPVFPESMEAFIRGSLEKELHGCARLLSNGLGHNPREIKRFINTFTFNHAMASVSNIAGYNPEVLAAIQLILNGDNKLFERISNDPKSLQDIAKAAADTTTITGGNLDVPPRLRGAIKALATIHPEILIQYIYLTKLVSLSTNDDGTTQTFDLHAIVVAHKLWIDSKTIDGRQASLRGAPLEDIRLLDVNLSRSILVKALVSRSLLHGVDLNNSDLSESNFEGSTLTEVDFSGANLTSANISSAVGSRLNFTGVQAKDAKFCGAKFQRSNFHDSYLEGSDFAGAILDYSDFQGAKVAGTSFAGASLKSANMAGLDLRFSDLSGTTLTRAVLSNSILCGMNLANLDLSYVIAENADFRGADLVGTNLTGARLKGTDLHGADLTGAVLLNADIGEAVGLTEEQLQTAVTDSPVLRKTKKSTVRRAQ